jgi:hypothetical protein
MLMKQLIQSAQCNGVKQLYSIDLSDSAAMRSLAKDLGMSANRDPNDPHQDLLAAVVGQDRSRQRVGAQ